MASSILSVVAQFLPERQQAALDAAFHDLRVQINRGEEEPVISVITASIFGVEGLKHITAKLEKAFDAHMAVDVDLIANTVTITPILHMPSEHDTSFSCESGVIQKKTKVPRPPNAFILYRKERHADIVAANPGLHNNRISILLGEKWRTESQTVRDEYKRQAVQAKEEHAFLHPNYSYQPRKSSEKKRRMTKSKLARLGLIAPSDMPIVNFNEFPGHAFFDADEDFHGTLGGLLDKAKVEADGSMSASGHTWIANTTNGYIVDDVAHIPVTPISRPCFSQDPVWSAMADDLAGQSLPFFYSNDSALPGPGYRGSNLASTTTHHETIEIQRQISLQEEMNALFDFEGAASPVTAPNDDELDVDTDDSCFDMFMLDPVIMNSTTW